jgi:hypothetical protein
MKKTITAITLLSFTFLSLNVHMHEHEHAENADHASDYNTVEEDCDFCQFNSENFFVEISTTSAKINFKNIIFRQYVSNYMMFNIFCFLNKSPPQ